MISSIIIKNVRKKYYPSAFTLRVDSLELGNRGIHALVGPNGSGKTSLLKIIALMDRPEEGKILFNGETTLLNNKTPRRLRKKIGFITQRPYLFNMSVFENIALGLKIRKREKSEIIRKVEDMLAALNLKHASTQRVKSLSRGEYQKVAIAQILILKPDIILMDEPVANVDFESTAVIENMVKNIQKEYNPIIIITAHSLAQVPEISSNIVSIEKGRIARSMRGRPRANFEIKPVEVLR